MWAIAFELHHNCFIVRITRRIDIGGHKAIQIVERGNTIGDLLSDLADVHSGWVVGLPVNGYLLAADRSHSLRSVPVVDVFREQIQHDVLDELILEGVFAEVVVIFEARTDGFVIFGSVGE